MSFPVPPSHKTFTFGDVTIDSNFDSGNCSHAEKVSNNHYNVWIATDHPKNNYRTWFHFSIQGPPKGTTVTFKIKNMQNQVSLEDIPRLVPVFREEGSEEWKRIKEKVNTSAIEFNQGWIEWSFKHTMTSNEKAFFAFFYPWSNEDNDRFLKTIEERCQSLKDIYFHRTTIIHSLEGRPVQFLTISSKKGLLNKEEAIEDKHLFLNQKKPKAFNCDKKCAVIGARVHPGEVPGSHVMTGIIDELTKDTQTARILRDNMVFHIFPIFNPDGVGRGHYRVDTNGINLNRCYINPSPKEHSPIYAVKKWVMYLHHENKYWGFLDLHAHASRRGIFIYGNSSNELQKQVDTCIFPKILSMNSENFEYEGSNFTEKNMHCKDRGDHMSKDGAGRVAIFKATKNAHSWTLECNYNMNKVTNVLEGKKLPEEDRITLNQNQLDEKIIVPYREPNQVKPTTFYTVETYRKLGTEICESLLDMLELNPCSRIQNPKSHFKSVQNLKMNLAMALLRMAPSRFQSHFKRIYNAAEAKQSHQLSSRALEALYLMLIKRAKIGSINDFLKKKDNSSVVLPTEPKKGSVTKSVNKLNVMRSQSFRNNDSKGPVSRRRLESLQLRKKKEETERSTAQNQEFNELKGEIANSLNLDAKAEQSQERGQQCSHLNQGQVYIEQKLADGFEPIRLQSFKLGKASSVSEQHDSKRTSAHVEEYRMIGIQRVKGIMGLQLRSKNQKASHFKGNEEHNFRISCSNNPKNLKNKYWSNVVNNRVKEQFPFVLNYDSVRNGKSGLHQKSAGVNNMMKKMNSLAFDDRTVKGDSPGAKIFFDDRMQS